MEARISDDHLRIFINAALFLCRKDALF